jgi:hypothetical protein
MSAKKKRQDAFKAKEKKQKIIAAVGGVFLVGLLAFQVPRVMAQMNRGKGAQPTVPPVSSSASGASTTTPSLEAPTTVRGQETAGGSTGLGLAAPASASLASASGTPTRGQLASFSRFESKDPFAQQVKAGASAATAASGSGSRVGSDASGGDGTGGAGATGSGGTGATGSGGSGSAPTATGTQPVPGSAVLSVNGTLMAVSVGTDFPQSSTTEPNATPIFHLVSLTMTTAKISIAGGSYTSGASTVTLRVNKPVTLMNTADGSRFKLILKPQGTAVPGAGGMTTTPVTLPAPTP